MEDYAPLDENSESLPPIREQLNNDLEKDQQQQQSPLSEKRQVSNKSIDSLAEAETDLDATESLQSVLNSVVKVFCTSTPCNFSLPCYNQLQLIGYIIPVSVIKHLLDDIELHDKYTGFPRMAFRYQSMENSSYREYLKLNHDQHGILVTSVEPACVLSKVLQEDDVITEIDGVPIADDGTVHFRRGERLSFRYLEKLKFVDDRVTFTIIRQGKQLTLTSRLDNNQELVPSHSHDKCPEYLIYAGIVFTVLTRFYLYEWGKRDWYEKAPKHLVDLAYEAKLQEPDQQIVIINRILVDDVNHGVDSELKNSVLETVNGIKINNIKHLAELIDKISKDDDNGFIRFEMDNKNVIVMSCKQVAQSEARILKQNSIAQPRSENLC
ncbi:unnamed protein product [Rotaria magnacalcarata]